MFSRLIAISDSEISTRFAPTGQNTGGAFFFYPRYAPTGREYKIELSHHDFKVIKANYSFVPTGDNTLRECV